MKKTTLKPTTNLTNRLAKYSALTVAIAGVADASGQIIYTDIADVSIDPASAVYALDLNNDGTEDYLMQVTANDSMGNPPASLGAFMFAAGSSAYNSNGIVGFTASSYNYPSNLASGAAISAGNALMPGSTRGDMYWQTCYPASQFCGGTDGFVGLHLKIGANTHYGWARVQAVQAGGEFSGTMIIKDYAYESTPDTPINAGQSLSVEDFDQGHNYVISFADNQVTIGSIVDKANYRVISISGQIVMNGSSNSQNQVIDLSNLSSGIYIVEVTDGDEQRIQRKKVLVN